MEAELLKIHPDNPQESRIKQVADCLKNGGLVILPTDTVYVIACNLYSKKAIEKLCLIQGKKPDKINLSFVCYDLSNIAEYVLSLDTPLFKVMKKVLPGPYTFLLKANSNVPKILTPKKKTVGIRIPDNHIARSVTHTLGNPYLVSSVKDEDEIIEYTTDPVEIHERYKKLVDIVVDGGYGQTTPSTIIDCTDGSPQIIREGLGKINELV